MDDQNFLNNCIWPQVFSSTLSFGFFGDVHASGDHIWLPLCRSHPHESEAHLGAVYCSGECFSMPERKESRYEELYPDDLIYPKLNGRLEKVVEINGKKYLPLGDGILPPQIEG